MPTAKEKVIQAAISILNREGADNLTMRTLAHELNRTAASLYNHIRNKQELFGEIAEYMCMDFVIPKKTLSPLDFMTEAHRAYRTMLQTVRDSPVVFENSLPITPGRVALIRTISEAYIAFGVPRELLMMVSNMVNNYVLSFVADEYRFKSRSAEEVKAFITEMNIDAPAIVLSPIDFDTQFDYGLQILFAWIESIIVIHE